MGKPKSKRLPTGPLQYVIGRGYGFTEENNPDGFRIRHAILQKHCDDYRNVKGKNQNAQKAVIVKQAFDEMVKKGIQFFVVENRKLVKLLGFDDTIQSNIRQALRDTYNNGLNDIAAETLTAQQDTEGGNTMRGKGTETASNNARKRKSFTDAGTEDDSAQPLDDSETNNRFKRTHVDSTENEGESGNLSTPLEDDDASLNSGNEALKLVSHSNFGNMSPLPHDQVETMDMNGFFFATPKTMEFPEDVPTMIPAREETVPPESSVDATKETRYPLMNEGLDSYTAFASTHEHYDDPPALNAGNDDDKCYQNVLCSTSPEQPAPSLRTMQTASPSGMVDGDGMGNGTHEVAADIGSNSAQSVNRLGLQLSVVPGKHPTNDLLQESCDEAPSWISDLQENAEMVPLSDDDVSRNFKNQYYPSDDDSDAEPYSSLHQHGEYSDIRENDSYPPLPPNPSLEVKKPERDFESHGDANSAEHVSNPAPADDVALPGGFSYEGPIDNQELACWGRLQREGRIEVHNLSTHQGRIPGSTNGCAVISALVVATHLNSEGNISDEQIIVIIDETCVPMLRAIRQKLRISGYGCIVPSDVHNHLVDEGILLQCQFVDKVVGDILNLENTNPLLELLEASGAKKASATFFFSGHVISIVKGFDADGSKFYDWIDSLPGSGSGTRTRCVDIEALRIQLHVYAMSKLNSTEVGAPWDDSAAEANPRVFEGFVCSDRDTDN